GDLLREILGALLERAAGLLQLQAQLVALAAGVTERDLELTELLVEALLQLRLLLAQPLMGLARLGILARGILEPGLQGRDGLLALVARLIERLLQRLDLTLQLALAGVALGDGALELLLRAGQLLV